MPLRRREVLALGGVAVAAGLGGLLFGRWMTGGDADETMSLANASFADLNGQTRKLAEWSGNVVIVNFWATWCGPCREEIPMFMEARKQYRQTGVEFVGIAIDQVSKVSQYAKDIGMTYPVLLAEADGLDLLRRLGNRSGGLPYTVVLNRTGVPVRRKLGALHRQELDAMIEAAISGKG